MSDVTSFDNFLGGLATLKRFERGHAAYEVDAAGDLVHAETVVTVRMREREDLFAFHQRLRADYGLRPGDKIEILNNGGTCDTVRLTLAPRPAV